MIEEVISPVDRDSSIKILMGSRIAFMRKSGKIVEMASDISYFNDIFPGLLLIEIGLAQCLP